MLNTAVIGYGYWGPKLARNFATASNTNLTMICDKDVDRLASINNAYPNVSTTKNIENVYENQDINAIAIATPVSTHYEIALKALQAGKHVLVEKPLTARVDQAKHLIEEAAKRNLTLMVDHPFLYTGAVRKIRELIENGEIGDIYYYDSVRINLGLFQHDVSVLWDLAVHDLSIMDFILKERPVSVSATGISHVPGEPENTAYLTLFFESDIIAHIHVNWLAPAKIRQTLVSGSKKMIVYDDLNPSDKVRVYDKGIELGDDPQGRYNQLIGYRTGDLWCPQIDLTEALLSLVNHFAACAEGKEQPISSADQGLLVVKVLEAATKSMELRGQEVKLDR